MQNRLTFFLTLGSTLTIGLYGLIGAWYTELMKDVVEQRGAAIAVIFVFIIIFFWATIACFLEALTTIEKRKG